MKRCAILIGNNRYEEPSLGDLRCPGTDVDEVAAVLEATDLGAFNVRPLKDQPCEKVQKAIYKVLKDATHDDLVLIYFSGHGVLDEKDELYLATKDTDKQLLGLSAVRVKDIRDWIDASKCRRNVLILDCCHAGAAGRKGGLDTQLKANADAGHGFYILSACTAIQTAKEKEADTNSLYTKHLLEGIRTGAADSDGDGWISAVDLHDYIHGQLRNIRGQEPDMWPAPIQEPEMAVTGGRGKLRIAKSGLPRQKRGEMLHERFAPLVAQKTIKLNDRIISEALSLAEKPLRELTEQENRRDVLIDDFLQRKLTFIEFRDAWLQINSAEKNTPLPSRERGRGEGDGRAPAAEEPHKGSSNRQATITPSAALSPANPSVDPTPVTPRRHWSERLKIGFFFLAMFGLFIGVIIKENFLDRAEMPDFTGGTLAEAQAVLDQHRWQYEVRRHFNPVPDSGTVFDQEPTGGVTFKPSETRIVLIVAESVMVPDLVGLKLDQARELLALRGLAMVKSLEQTDNTRPEGSILSQDLPAGRKVAPGSGVTLTIATHTRTETQAMEPEVETPEVTSPPIGSTFRDPLKDGGEGPEMVMIPAGEFLMGSPANEVGRIAERERQHSVTIKQPFAIGKYEVTVGEFRQFVEAEDYRTEAEQGDGCFRYSGGNWQQVADANWKGPGFSQDENHPVVCVSWNDAMAYVDWLSEQTGHEYRLPTEAEWEYAARAKTPTARFWSDDPVQACDYANVADQMAKRQFSGWTIHECDDGHVYTAPVGQFRPNDWELHDMLGNVWEWTCSEFNAAYGSAEQECASVGSTAARAVRGGSWSYFPAWVRSAYRTRNTPVDRNDVQGFRLARSP